MVTVTMTDNQRSLLERVCEQQGWEELRKALRLECLVCRKLADGLCSHK